MIASIRDGDEILLDARAGTLSVNISDTELATRVPEVGGLQENQWGLGRELFDGFRSQVSRRRTGRHEHSTASEPANPTVTSESAVHEH